MQLEFSGQELLYEASQTTKCIHLEDHLPLLELAGPMKAQAPIQAWPSVLKPGHSNQGVQQLTRFSCHCLRLLLIAQPSQAKEPRSFWVIADFSDTQTEHVG